MSQLCGVVTMDKHATLPSAPKVPGNRRMRVRPSNEKNKYTCKSRRNRMKVSAACSVRRRRYLRSRLHGVMTANKPATSAKSHAGTRGYPKVPGGTRWYPMYPTVSGTFIQNSKPRWYASGTRWYAVVRGGTRRYPMVRETYDRELRRYAKVREGTRVAP